MIKKIKYWKSIFFKKLEMIRNRHQLPKYESKGLDNDLVSWMGLNYIHMHHDKADKIHKVRKYYSYVKGHSGAIKIQDTNTISYDDHLTRIRTPDEKIKTACFHKPNLSADHFSTYHINQANAETKYKIKQLLKKYPYLGDIPKPFEYFAMEANASLLPPANIGLPPEIENDKHFFFNFGNQMTENVLHMPIKISKSKAHELKKEGRTLIDGISEISHQDFYLPKELSYAHAFIKYICNIESELNPCFLDDYYIFLTVNNTMVPTNGMQRRGGWHIDGHQGHERMQKNGEKLPCDRQYIICNVLPTESIQCQMDFSEVREYCRRQFCHMDSVNMQDVIERSIAKIPEDQRKMTTIDANQLFFLNPYMIHKAKINHGPPIRRTFMRILCSTFTRNRLGDTINPVLGPVYPLKIKTITDIHEISE